METLALVIMTVGSWVLVIGMITVLGRLYSATKDTSRETAQNSAQDAAKVVYLDGANNTPEEDKKADATARAAA